MSLEGKVALITGGARGLGRAYVLHLARLGADIVIADIDLQAAREYGEELTAETVEAEVVKPWSPRRGHCRGLSRTAAPVDALVAESLAAFGRIDILVNNAGGNLRSHEEQAASLAGEDHYRYIMDINLTATIHCCQAVSAAMKEAQSGKNRQRGLASGLVEWARWRRDALQGGQGRHRPLHAGARRRARPLWDSRQLHCSGSNFVVSRRGSGPQ